MFSRCHNDVNHKNSKDKLKEKKSKETNVKALSSNINGTFPQIAANNSVPVSVGSLGANLSLINLALFAVQVNVAKGGDSQSISVNGFTQSNDV